MPEDKTCTFSPGLSANFLPVKTPETPRGWERGGLKTRNRWSPCLKLWGQSQSENATRLWRHFAVFSQAGNTMMVGLGFQNDAVISSITLMWRSCSNSGIILDMEMGTKQRQTRALISVKATHLSKLTVPLFATRCSTDHNGVHHLGHGGGHIGKFQYLPQGAAIRGPPYWPVLVFATYSTEGATILDHEGSHVGQLLRQGVWELSIGVLQGVPTTSYIHDDDGWPQQQEQHHDSDKPHGPKGQKGQNLCAVNRLAKLMFHMSSGRWKTSWLTSSKDTLGGTIVWWLKLVMWGGGAKQWEVLKKRC